MCRCSARSAALLSAALLPACQRDYDQPRYDPLEASSLFPDGKSARPLPEGTFAVDDPRLDAELWAGRAPEGGYVDEPPFPLTVALLARGRERYDVFCSPCHGFTGRGDGMIVQRGYRPPPSFHTDRMRAHPLGYLVDVITNGFGVMPLYADRIPARDRWAIAAYVRALQISQDIPLADLPPEDAARLEDIR